MKKRNETRGRKVTEKGQREIRKGKKKGKGEKIVRQ